MLANGITTQRQESEDGEQKSAAAKLIEGTALSRMALAAETGW